MALVDFCREGRQESGCFRKCYETSAIWFGLSTMNKINPMIEQILVQRTNHIGLVWQHLRRTAGREYPSSLLASLLVKVYQRNSNLFPLVRTKKG